MRLDSLGKPPLLQVVSEPKKAKGIGDASLKPEVKNLSKTPEGSLSSMGHEKLGQIIEILARSKKDNPKKKKKCKVEVLLAIQEYKRVEKIFQQEWNLGQKQRGDKIDVKG